MEAASRAAHPLESDRARYVECRARFAASTGNGTPATLKTTWNQRGRTRAWIRHCPRVLESATTMAAPTPQFSSATRMIT